MNSVSPINFVLKKASIFKYSNNSKTTTYRCHFPKMTVDLMRRFCTNVDVDVRPTSQLFAVACLWSVNHFTEKIKKLENGSLCKFGVISWNYLTKWLFILLFFIYLFCFIYCFSSFFFLLMKDKQCCKKRLCLNFFYITPFLSLFFGAHFLGPVFFLLFFSLRHTYVYLLSYCTMKHNDFKVFIARFEFQIQI